MRMIPVQSTNIAAIGFEAGELCVQFHSGARWSHFNVPAEAHSAFLAAESHGKHYAAVIKPAYPGRPTGDVHRSNGHAAHPADPLLERSMRELRGERGEPEMPTTIEGVLHRLNLPLDSVMRGSIETMMSYLPVETIIERFGGS